ncbi:MAG: hypothetical protein KDK70_39430, partial [Myxococcales bacterium]|nr:hypothetical protein [Myxococcales bacterium]
DRLTAGPHPAARTLGTPTTLFVNFDGVELDGCNPSDSHANCHWYNFDAPIPAFSGSTQTKVSVLQAMRRDAADYGIRITGQRPAADQIYTMVVYGGTEVAYGALGSAPSGDCGDQLPNQIAFAHMDGELVEWVNGGATTALHEAAHSWGLDHIDTSRSIMFPSADDSPTAFQGECAQVVASVDLDPGPASCPELNQGQCGGADLQNARMRLAELFGGPYVDVQAPIVSLVEPADGQYFQAPADFDVVLDIRDDLHPQVYDATFWLNDDPKPEPRPFIVDRFAVTALPVGTWAFHVELVDEAGNASRLDFEIEVGEDPPPEPSMDEGGCAVGGAQPRGWGVSGLLALVVLLPCVARRRYPR